MNLENLITHEAGHFLGLGHSELPSATMAARADLAEIEKRSLIDDDSAALCSIYGAFPAPRCEPKDFLPNHGFVPECAAAAADMPASSCSAGLAPGATSSRDGIVWLLALSVVTLLGRRAQARATKS